MQVFFIAPPAQCNEASNAVGMIQSKPKALKAHISRARALKVRNSHCPER
jgi:hypothetical protein